MTWAGRLAALSSEDSSSSDSSDRSDRASAAAIGATGAIGTEKECEGRLSDIDAAFEAEERAAIAAEGEHGDPLAPVPHEMPVSWADPDIVPTPGARCRNCGGSRWWCEATSPRGWRCSSCHPGGHLAADRRRDVMT